MKNEINPDELKNIKADFETAQSDFAEILLSTQNCDLLGINDETAIFNLRAMQKVSNLLSRMISNAENAKNQ
jgi:hypothetical protein